MGLRTASVRHPHVAVMAPALTETNQSQSFKLSSNAHPQSRSPIRGLEETNVYISLEGESKDEENINSCQTSGKDLGNVFDNLNTLALASELLKENTCLGESRASENGLNPTDSCSMMNNSPISMGDQEEKMGLQKTVLDTVSTALKDKHPSEVDQLLNNIGSVLPTSDICAAGDIGQNVEDFMQVIKSISMEGGGDRLNPSSNDLGTETDNMFALSSTDLTGNLTSFEKELLNDVDMMSISMEEQLMDGTAARETQTKDMIAELHRKQAKVERKLDFLIRRVRKMQVKHMGQHVSGEIAGVFEHVHRTLRKLKDSVAMQTQSDIQRPPEMDFTIAPPPPTVSSDSVSSGKPKAMSQGSAKSLVRKLEMTSILQANAASRQRHSARYFGSGSAEPGTFRSGVTGMTTLPPWPVECKQELQKITGSLYTELSIAQAEVDSEATASSSGGESADEMQNYNNPHQQSLSIQKRAVWRYLTDRAAIAARWTWLQAQISDLEYRIRQHSDLHKQIRSQKSAVELEGCNPPHSIPTSPTAAVNGYRGQAPGISPVTSKASDNPANGAISNHVDLQCARTRALHNFRKRKLLQINGLHAVSKKAARPSSIRCGCAPPATSCALCTGRTDPTHPRDLTESLSKPERIALLDPCFHPVFSLPEDVSASIHFEAIMKTPEWQQRSNRSNIKTMKLTSKADRFDKLGLPLENRPKKLDHRRKYSRLLKSSTVNALTSKIKRLRGRKSGRHPSLNRMHKKRHTAKVAMAQLQALQSEGIDEELESLGSNSANILKMESPSSSPLLPASGYKRNRINSYDIDNIVIPYSVAASTRVEKLQYKEILTPKWRIADPEFSYKCDSRSNEIRNPSQDSDAEDTSEEAVQARHDKCEHDEKKKFLSYLKLPLGYGRSRSHKRTDSRAESSGANTPDPMSPHAGDHLENMNSPMTSPPATPMPAATEDSSSLPSISVMRRRTISQSRWAKERESTRDENRCNTPEHVDVPPYEKRVFPLVDDVYDKMLKHMPENHQLQTNIRAQDSRSYNSPESYLDDKLDSPGSESTESALGEEDPNDPEWIDMERVRDRHKR